MRPRVLITGASGHVGREVVYTLQARGFSVTAAGSDESHLRELFDVEVATAKLDFRDPTTWRDAACGHQHIFLMRPPAIADVENSINPFIDEARRCGVDHIVFLSVAGAGSNPFVPHRKVEVHLRGLGEHYTSLRPGFFAQNLQSAYRRDIIEEDRIYVPAGRKPVNWIDVRDIADVVALVLEDSKTHSGKSYTLTGPGAVPWSEVTSALSSASGRKIRYEPASVIGYVRHLARRGLPAGAIMVQTILHFLLRFGQGATEDPTLERLLGRPGRSVRQYINEHADLWIKPCGAVPKKAR